jgi:hypothetical protein
VKVSLSQNNIVFTDRAIAPDEAALKELEKQIRGVAFP